MKEFFGFGGYQREPEGFFSWQHLLFVTSLMVIMVLLALFLGKKNKDKSLEEKNKVLIVAAIAINAFELIKIIVVCARNEDFGKILQLLPLFLCSIQLIALPIAAFTKGRLKEAALDFVFVFGILGAVLGTYGAGQNYNAYPVLSMDNVVSGITHSISGFASLYIAFAKMDSMKKENIPLVFGILAAFCVLAYVVNILVDYNYMFLMRGDGTPYDILYNLVGGNKVLYPLSVVLLFYAYILAFQWIHSLIKNKANGTETAENAEETEAPVAEKTEEAEVLEEASMAEFPQE